MAVSSFWRLLDTKILVLAAPEELVSNQERWHCRLCMRWSYGLTNKLTYTNCATFPLELLPKIKGQGGEWGRWKKKRKKWMDIYLSVMAAEHG